MWKIYSCDDCHIMFKTKSGLCRHNFQCRRKTNLIFPGGYNVYHATLFDELDRISIHVLKEDNFFLWDLESMLVPIESVVEGGKITFTHTHQPVSCSISWNIEEYKNPRFITSENVKELVAEMFSTFTHMSKQVFENSKQ